MIGVTSLSYVTPSSTPVIVGGVVSSGSGSGVTIPVIFITSIALFPASSSAYIVYVPFCLIITTASADLSSAIILSIVPSFSK